MDENHASNFIKSIEATFDKSIVRAELRSNAILIKILDKCLIMDLEFKKTAALIDIPGESGAYYVSSVQQFNPSYSTVSFNNQK